MVRREFRRERQAWFQHPVYAGVISVDTDIGLLCAPISGVLVTRVILKVRGTLDYDEDNYWTISVIRLDTDANEEEVESINTTETTLTEGLSFDVFNRGPEQRLEANHEIILRFATTGSPSALSQVQAYLDGLVGV